ATALIAQNAPTALSVARFAVTLTSSGTVISVHSTLDCHDPLASTPRCPARCARHRITAVDRPVRPPSATYPPPGGPSSPRPAAPAGTGAGRGARPAPTGPARSPAAPARSPAGSPRPRPRAGRPPGADAATVSAQRPAPGGAAQCAVRPRGHASRGSVGGRPG